MTIFHSFFNDLVGACAHLTSFYGTDTVSGCILAYNYYLATEMAASSIPASEHSTMVSWTRKREREAYENMLGLFEYHHEIYMKRIDFFSLDRYVSKRFYCLCI